MAVLPSLNSIRVGTYVLVNDDPYQVVEAHFVRMQQRKPVMQTKLKNMINGKVLEVSFKPGDRVQEADLEKRKCAFLYRDDRDIYCMDQETFEQFSLTVDLLGERVYLLRDEMILDVLLFNGNPISLSLPPKVDLRVTTAPPSVKGDSASNVTKQVTLESGLIVNVPLFIKEGDVIRINSDTCEYVERVN